MNSNYSMTVLIVNSNCTKTKLHRHQLSPSFITVLSASGGC